MSYTLAVHPVGYTGTGTDKRQAYLASGNFKPVTARTVTDPRRLGAILSQVDKDG
jgi:hypothetical protein